MISVLIAFLVSFFTARNSPPKTVNAPTTLVLTGDIMVGRSVMGVSLSKKNPTYPFEKVADILQNADIALGNLENPIIANCPASDSGFVFCADPRMLEGLSVAGIDIVSLANNHTNNYGEDGIQQTEKYLKTADIDYTGRGNLVTKEIKSTRFGFLGFNLLDRKLQDADYKLIQDSKAAVDILIVMVHWGVEYAAEPTQTQKIAAADIVGAGADVVVGAHPHWVQSIEYINGKPIFYSLGNFVFDQAWSEETKKGMAVRLTYQGSQLVKIENLPIYMKHFAQPEWIKEGRKVIFSHDN